MRRRVRRLHRLRRPRGRIRFDTGRQGPKGGSGHRCGRPRPPLLFEQKEEREGCIRCFWCCVPGPFSPGLAAGACGCADDAHPDAHAQALDKEQRKAGNPEEGGNAGRVEEQAGQQDGAAAQQGEQIAGGETAHEAADDHDARRKPRGAQAGSIRRAGITGAGDEHEVIRRHQQKVDERDHGKVAAEDGAQGLEAPLCLVGLGTGVRATLCGHVSSSGWIVARATIYVVFPGVSSYSAQAYDQRDGRHAAKSCLHAVGMPLTRTGVSMNGAHGGADVLEYVWN